jgi:hypothetical protein
VEDDEHPKGPTLVRLVATTPLTTPGLRVW